MTDVIAERVVAMVGAGRLRQSDGSVVDIEVESGLRRLRDSARAVDIAAPCDIISSRRSGTGGVHLMRATFRRPDLGHAYQDQFDARREFRLAGDPHLDRRLDVAYRRRHHCSDDRWVLPAKPFEVAAADQSLHVVIDDALARAGITAGRRASSGAL